MINYSSRKARLQLKMKAKQIDVCIITQNVDLYYFTGSMQTGYLVIPAAGEAIFFVRRSIARAQQESAVTIEALGSLRDFAALLEERYQNIFNEATTSIFLLQSSMCCLCSNSDAWKQPCLMWLGWMALCLCVKRE